MLRFASTPVLLPLAMMLLNIAVFFAGLLGEGRLKVNCVRFFFLYAATVVPAKRGDLEPFFTVFSSPA